MIKQCSTIKRTSERVLLPEILSKLLKITRRKTQIHLQLQTLLLRQTNLLGQILALCLSPTVVLQFHVQIQRDVRSIGTTAPLKRTLESLLYHVGSSPYFLLAFLSPNGHPVPLGIVELLNFLDQNFVSLRVLLDFGDHNLVEEVDLPKLLIVATLFIILGIDYMKTSILGSVE